MSKEPSPRHVIKDDFNEGLATMKINDHWGYIDRGFTQAAKVSNEIKYPAG